MHAWLDFLTKLQKLTSFAYSWSTSREYKILDAVTPDELLAAKASASSYQIEEHKHSSLVVILYCLYTTTAWHFQYLMYCLGKTIVFPHFIMATIPHVKCDVGSGRENCFLQHLFIILCFQDIWIQLNVTFRQIFWFHFQFRAICTAVK